MSDSARAIATRPQGGTLFYFLSSNSAGRMYGPADGAASAAVRAQTVPDVATVSPLGRMLSRIADRYFDSLESPAQFNGQRLEGFVLQEVRALPALS